jgi:hypothetical protein
MSAPRFREGTPPCRETNPIPSFFQFLAGQVGHALVLAEDHHLAAFFDRQLADDLAKLGELRRMVRLLVEEKRGIAEHPHVLQAAQDPLLVDFGEPACRSHLRIRAGQDVVLFPVWFRLLRRQRNVENLVGAVRQILQNLLPRAPQQDRRQLVVNTVQAAVADQGSVFVLRPVLVEEAERGTEAAAVDELHHGKQLLQLVLERRSVSTKA